MGVQGLLQKGEGRSAENHYRTMSAEDLYNLDANGIADKDCVLFLWVTFPCLLEGLEAIRRWGNEIDGLDIREAITKLKETEE